MPSFTPAQVIASLETLGLNPEKFDPEAIAEDLTNRTKQNESLKDLLNAPETMSICPDLIW